MFSHLIFALFLNFFFINSQCDNFLTNGDAELGSTTSWYTFANGPSLKISSDVYHNGHYSFRMEGRTQYYHGPATNIKELVTSGKIISGQRFTYSVWVRHDENAPKNMQLNVKKVDGSGTKYLLLDNQAVAPNVWKRLLKHYILTISGTLRSLELYVTTSSPETFPFFADDFAIGNLENYVAPSSSDPANYIRAKGKNLVVGAEETSFVLKGVNIFMAVDSSDNAQTIWDIRTISSEEFDKIRNIGFNSIRLAINYKILEDDTKPGIYKEDGWSWLDRAIDLTKNSGLKVLIDMHAPPGGYQSSKSQGFSSFWGSSKTVLNTSNQQRLINLWKAIASRYKYETEVIGYDLINEPRPYTSQQWFNYAELVIAAIRSVDPWHLIDVEAPFISNSVFIKVNDANVMYDSHEYTPWEYASQYSTSYNTGLWGKYDPLQSAYIAWINGNLKVVPEGTAGAVPFDKNYLQQAFNEDILSFASENSVPVSIGEYGVTYQSFNYDVGSVKYLQDFTDILDQTNSLGVPLNRFYFCYQGSPFSIYTNWVGYETNEQEVSLPLKQFFIDYFNQN